MTVDLYAVHMSSSGAGADGDKCRADHMSSTLSRRRVLTAAAAFGGFTIVGISVAACQQIRHLGAVADDGRTPATPGASGPTALPAAVTDAGSRRPSTFPALPDRVVSMWMFTFDPPSLGQLPADVVDVLSHVVFGMAQSAAPGTATLRWTPTTQGADETATQIARLVARDMPVLLGIGGSSDGGITLTNDVQVDQMVTSIGEMVDRYGFTGIDLDLEPSGSSWSEASVAAAAKALKKRYGQTFLVGLTVALYGDHTARWLSLARALGDDFDYWAPMLYDFPEAGDTRLVQIAADRVATAVAGGIPARKQVLGFMCNAPQNSSPVDVAGQVWAGVHEAHRDIRGAFIWESKLEKAADYAWTRKVGKLIAG